MDLLLFIGGAETVESGFSLTAPPAFFGMTLSDVEAISVGPASLIFNGPRGSFGVPGDMTVGGAELSFYGGSVWYSFSAGSMTAGPASLFVFETTFGMIGAFGDLSVGAATLLFDGVGGAYVGSDFSLTVAPATLLFAVANGVVAAAQEYTLYAMNMKTGAVTKLPHAVDSFCELNGLVYAAGPAGIMIFEGSNTNNGADINARIAKSGIGFGTSMEKKITDLYMLCRTQGSIKVTSSSEMAAGSVTTGDGIDVLHGFKSDMPRGVKGRALGIAVENVDGCDFEIAELEFEVDISASRRGRQTRS